MVQSQTIVPKDFTQYCSSPPLCTMISYGYTLSLERIFCHHTAKGKRAMGSLMGSIDKTIVKPEMSLKLFNSLVKPILLYGSQIWLPVPLLAPKQVIGLSTPNLATFFNSHAECGGERVHLRFLKWILGVNKKTTNVFTWGELGEVPLLFSALDQAVSYYKRVSAAPACRISHV